MSVNPSFSAFWAGHKKHVFRYTIKFVLGYPLILIFGGILMLVFNTFLFSNEADNFYKPQDFLIKQTWIDIYPKFIFGVFLGYVIALPIIHLSVLYLEWDKYKKDEASWFTHGKGCEGPPGYTRRLKWVMAASWDIDAHTLVAVDMGERHKRYEGHFSEDALLREIRRKFARSENKPTEDTETSIRWRIIQNNGREVHIHLQRQPLEPVTWVMTTQFYEWVGRRQPPRLAQTHTTEFVVQATNEGQSGAEGQG